LPRAAEDYARLHGLYHPITKDIYEMAKTTLQERLSAYRFNHTLGVVQVAERLAAHYGVDVQKARLAALLHDCAKEYSSDKKRALCQLWAVTLDNVLKNQIDITHSILGAESALRDFYVNDQEILQAIRYHTTGHKNMTLLDKIIMLADYIEPNREDYGPLADMRKLAFYSMDKALIIGLKDTIKEEEKNGKPIHPWSRDALKELKTCVSKEKGSAK